MPYFESPALFIDFARLPPPAVIEEIDFEDLQAARQADVLAANPALERALKLEQSPTNIVLESGSYAEMRVRARVNAAARAVMLAFAKGTDLDQIGARYNCGRLPLVDLPNPYVTNPEDWEDNERYRRRIQLAPEAFTTAGSAGAYVFHALTADATVRDASPMVIGPGRVKVSLMNSGADPTATPAQVDKVATYLLRKAIKPLTDDVTVTAAKVITTDIVAEVTLYPGPDAALILNDIAKALDALRTRISVIGRDLNRSAIIAACNQEGVQKVTLLSPTADLVAGADTCVFIRSGTVTPIAKRAE